MAQLYKMLDLNFRIIPVQPRNKRKFSLEEVQKMIGGYVEIVHLNGDDILLCDEEGRLKLLPINSMATEKAKAMGFKGDVLVGDVLFLKDNEF